MVYINMNDKTAMIYTVKDLIEKLQQYPEDMELNTQEEAIDEGNLYTHRTVRGVWIKIQRVKDLKITQRPCKETSGAIETLVFF